MNVSSSDRQRWVLDGIDKRTVRLAKELAIRHDCRIVDIVETALYQLYANPDRLKNFKPPVWHSYAG
jgi:hypothetical protein